MRRRVLVPIVAATLVLAGAARADSRFNDPAGDSGAAHDVTAVTVSNDTAQIVLTFPIPTPWPNLRQADDQAWLLTIDADRNPSTGDGGQEIRVFQKGGAEVYVWNGTAWADAPPAGISVRFLVGASDASWRVQLPRTLLRSSTGFDFQLSFAKFVGDDIAASDRAPDSGSWRYELAVAQCANDRDDDGDGKIDGGDLGCDDVNDDVEADETLTPLLLRASVAPANARPGSRVTVRARAQHLETGEPMGAGRVVCTIRAGTARQRVTGRISTGLAMCTLTAPRVARPTTVRGTMTIVGTSRSVPFSFRAG